MHLCDIETIERIAAYAPHILTPEDRRALRMFREAPAVQRRSYLGVACCTLALGLLALIGGAQ